MICPSCGAPNTEGARFCGGCGKAAIATETQASDSLPVIRAPELVGREIAGRYRIVAKLGEGGMGAVFRAEQLSLKRAVALKVLRPELSSNEALLMRFNAEAQLVAKLSHPNTVNIYDFGQDRDGSLFIAMELIDGRSLRAVLREAGPLPPARALAIAAQLAASLSDAHAHGIIHRDLKPDNAMLQDRGKERDIVRVLDFGIAKLRDDARGDQPTMTQAGDMLGTPQYMAPEQIRGEAIDGRTDIYALGCILYEMLTGRMVYEAPTVMALLGKHLTEAIVPPSQRRPDLGITPALDALVMAALQKVAAARPPTMEAYGDQLAAVLGTYAAPTTPQTAQQQWAQPSAQRTAQQTAQAYMAPVAAAPTPMAMQMPPRMPPPHAARASGGHGIIIIGALSAFAVLAVAFATLYIHNRHASGPGEASGPSDPSTPSSPNTPSSPIRSPLNGAAYGIYPAAPGIGLPPATDGWGGDGHPTAALPLPPDASLTPPPGTSPDLELGALHYVDADRDVEYLMAPLVPGSNDPRSLIQDYLRQHSGLRLVQVGTLASAGEPRSYAGFVGRDGPDNDPRGELAVVYLSSTYRLVVFVTAPPELFLDPAFGEQVADFYANGVHLP